MQPPGVVTLPVMMEVLLQAEAMVELVATLKLVHKVEVQLLPNLKQNGPTLLIRLYKMST